MDGEGIDFEPFGAFLSADLTRAWFREWTGNKDVEADSFRIFGQDGTGGYAAFWQIREKEELLAQPIFFFGSEGEVGVVARNFSDYLWLLASGHGPYEAICNLDDEKKPVAEFFDFAKQHATTPQSKPSDVVDRAEEEFPNFEEDISSLCR